MEVYIWVFLLCQVNTKVIHTEVDHLLKDTNSQNTGIYEMIKKCTYQLWRQDICKHFRFKKIFLAVPDHLCREM